MDIRRFLRDVLAERMAEQGITPSQLATRSDLSRPYVGRVISGERDASEAVWQRLMDASGPLTPAAPALASEGTLAATARVARDCKHGVPVPGHCRNCGMTKRTMADGTTVPNL